MLLSPDQPRRGSRGAENTLCSCCCWLRTRERPPNKRALCIKQDFPEINGYSSVRTDSKGKPTRRRSSTGGDGVQGMGPGTGTQPLLLLVRSFCILTPNPLQLRGEKNKRSPETAETIPVPFLWKSTYRQEGEGTDRTGEHTIMCKEIMSYFNINKLFKGKIKSHASIRQFFSRIHSIHTILIISTTMLFALF